MKYIRKYLGAFIMAISVMLAWLFYDWTLALVIFLFVTGNNIERDFE